MYFAQLNGSGVCVAITQPAAPLVGPQFIPIAQFNLSLLGKQWTGSAWIAGPG